MKKCILSLIILFNVSRAGSQNVGIGTTTPTGPLSFNSVLGNKIVLWGDGSAGHYGLGIQSGLLQVYSDAPAANIAFGYGRSQAFTERMRLLNFGGDGLALNGRVILKNGTNPLDLNYGSGIWMYKADNTAMLGFMGVQNNQNLGFYGGPAGWGFVYDAINSRVGIGNSSPVNRLDVTGIDNWDLSSTEGDVRIGSGNYRIKFGVALTGGGAGAAGIMQYGQPGGFNNLALGSQGTGLINLNGSGKFIDFTNATGGIRVDGNAGVAGQVLSSNGSGAAPSWITPSAISTFQFLQSAFQGGVVNYVAVPGLTQPFTCGAGKGVFILKGQMLNNGCFACGAQSCKYDIVVDGVLIDRNIITVGNGAEQVVTNGAIVYNLSAGTHTVAIYVDGNGGNFSAYGFRVIIMVVP